MPANGDEDYEHWPSIAIAEGAAAAPGYDVNNGIHYHSYVAAKAKSPSPPKDSKEPSPQPHVINYPQPVYYAHPPNMMAHPQAQYYSYPTYSVPQGYYQPYPAPAPAPAIAQAQTQAQAPAAPQAPAPPAEEPTMHFKGGSNTHVYVPTYGTAPKAEAATTASAGNVWLGRTTKEVEEDNMKIAKKEGAYDKRKIAPVGLKDDQMCWVVEVDGSHSLRMFRDIKEMTGYWKEDPRYKEAWYFVREEDKK